ncbi:hypothetical protein Cgig2_001084 [Carnegiea gigantea]|uniref:Uncharacterized protein n=1 Tax=Carnegiea gigantea TaxID=171969 RepID=A0A9Q1JL52_9CARY|nr:hypothetical protein Cgig2_001084 [Carnegiea gigantea]
MGPESNGRIRGVGNAVAPSKSHSESSTTSESSMIIMLKEVMSLHREVAYSTRGDAKSGHFEEGSTLNSSLHGGGKENVQIGHFEENTIDSSLHNANLRPNPKTQSRLIEIENSGVLGVKLESLHGLNMSSKSQMGKGNVVVPTGMENSMVLGHDGVWSNMNATSVKMPTKQRIHIPHKQDHSRHMTTLVALEDAGHASLT